jgi:hypothetical protein
MAEWQNGSFRFFSFFEGAGQPFWPFHLAPKNLQHHQTDEADLPLKLVVKKAPNVALSNHIQALSVPAIVFSLPGTSGIVDQVQSEFPATGEFHFHGLHIR